MIGGGDTYFSGKALAKLARIILVAQELKDLCASVRDGDITDSGYADACGNILLPTEEEISIALDQLRSAVEIWIKGDAQNPFVYDSAWGGLVKCGSNTFPKCPAFTDQFLNFGSGKFHEKGVPGPRT